jgi:hypothetical protein
LPSPSAPALLPASATDALAHRVDPPALPRALSAAAAEDHRGWHSASRDRAPPDGSPLAKSGKVSVPAPASPRAGALTAWPVGGAKLGLRGEVPLDQREPTSEARCLRSARRMRRPRPASAIARPRPRSAARRRAAAGIRHVRRSGPHPRRAPTRRASPRRAEREVAPRLGEGAARPPRSPRIERDALRGSAPRAQRALALGSGEVYGSPVLARRRPPPAAPRRSGARALRERREEGARPAPR